MKKLSLLLMAVACLCSKVANAQDGKGSINFVPYVGVNYSDFSGDASYYFGETSGKVNLMAGARFEFQITSNSAVIADLNYRRLGTTSEMFIMSGRSIPSIPSNLSKSVGIILDRSNPVGIFEDLKKDIYLNGGSGAVASSTKVTLDCVTFGAQFKQGIVAGLSARAGVEGTFSVAEKMHTHTMYCSADIDDKGNVINKSEGDSYGKSDVGDIFSDHLNLAIPLGLTYDYKNFSFNATYHLPLTRCAKDECGRDEYYMKHQAFDFTIGYRLPLRKR